jgi:hypothetical protein
MISEEEKKEIVSLCGGPPDSSDILRNCLLALIAARLGAVCNKLDTMVSKLDRTQFGE